MLSIPGAFFSSLSTALASSKFSGLPSMSSSILPMFLHWLDLINGFGLLRTSLKCSFHRVPILC